MENILNMKKLNEIGGAPRTPDTQQRDIELDKKNNSTTQVAQPSTYTKREQLFINPITKKKYETEQQYNSEIIQKYVNAPKFEPPITSKESLNIFLSNIKNGYYQSVTSKNNSQEVLFKKNYFKKLIEIINSKQLEQLLFDTVELNFNIQNTKQFNLNRTIKSIQKIYTANSAQEDEQYKFFPTKRNKEIYTSLNKHGVLYSIYLNIVAFSWFRSSEDEKRQIVELLPWDDISSALKRALDIDLLVSVIVEIFMELYDNALDRLDEEFESIKNLFSLENKQYVKPVQLKYKLPNTKRYSTIQLNGINNKYPDVFIIIDEIAVLWQTYLKNTIFFLTKKNNDIEIFDKIIVLLKQYKKIVFRFSDGITFFEKKLKIEDGWESAQFVQIFKEYSSKLNDFFDKYQCELLMEEIVISNNKQYIRAMTLKILKQLKNKFNELRNTINSYNNKK